MTDDRSEQYPLARVIILAKRVLFVCMLLFPIVVLGVFGITQWIYDIRHPSKTNEAQRPLPDASALEQDYGFTPKIGIREGLRAFAEWYREYYGSKE